MVYFVRKFCKKLREMNSAFVVFKKIKAKVEISNCDL